MDIFEAIHKMQARSSGSALGIAVHVSDLVSRRRLLNSSLAAAAFSGDGFALSSNCDLTRTVDVRAFGAKADGATDDAPAINAAIRAIRENEKKAAGFAVAPKLVFPAGIYAVSHSIDLSHLRAINLVIDGDSSIILGRCEGAPVIDALGSRWLTIRDLTIIGDKEYVPKVGLQIGLARNGVVADDHRFENVKIVGHYSLACLLNLAAETTGFDHVLLWNNFPAPESYCLIQDGLNHFGTTSAFVPKPSTTPQHDESFNENEFINCDFRHSGGGVPVWLGDTARHRFIRCYAAGTGAASFVVYCGLKSHSMLDIDCHCETRGLGSVFLFTGTLRRPVIRGFSYKDHVTFASRSVFRCHVNTEKVTLQNATIEIAGFFDQSCKVFDDPERWCVTGSYYSREVASWNGTKCFSGSILLDGDFAFTGAVGMKAVSGPTDQRPGGLTHADAGRLFLDLSLNKLIIWSGSAWIDAAGGQP